MADFLQGDPASFPQNNTMDIEAFKAGIARAVADGQRIPTPVAEDPTLLEKISAAYRQSNSIGSLTSSRTLRNTLGGDDSAPITPTTVLTELKALGLAHHAALFEDVGTRAEFDATVADLKQELKDRETLSASGGFLAELALGIVDPVNLIPIGGGVQKARVAGKAIQATTKTEFAKAFAKEAAGGAAISELALQASQVNRDWTDAAANMGASTIFGIGLGMGAYGLTKLVGQKTAQKITSTMDKDMDDLRAGGPELTKRMEASIQVQEALAPGKVTAEFKPAKMPPDTGPVSPENAAAAPVREFAQSDLPDPRLQSTLNEPGAPKSAGAAANNYEMVLLDRLNAKLGPVEMDNLVSKVGGAFGATVRDVPLVGKLATSVGDLFHVDVGGVKILGPLGTALAQGLRPVRLSLASDAISPNARKFALSVVPNPNPIAKEGAAGNHSVAVARHFDEEYGKIEGLRADVAKEVQDVWAASKKDFKNQSEFGERVFFASINDGVDEFGQHQGVERAAKAVRRLYDTIEQGLKEEGFLKDGVQLRGAKTYVPWVHNVQQIMKDKEQFISLHAERMAADFEADYNVAAMLATERARRQADEFQVIDAEKNVKIAEIRKEYDGEGWEKAQVPGQKGDTRVSTDNMGKIAEAEIAVRETQDDWKLKKQEGIDKLKERRDMALSAAEDQKQKAKARETYAADKAAFETKWAEDSKKAIADAKKKVEDTRAERDAKIKALENTAKKRQRDWELKNGPSAEERQWMELNTQDKREAKAEKIANAYYEGIIKGVDEFNLIDGVDVIGFPAILKARKALTTQKEASLRGWTDTNVFNLTDAYTRKAGAFLASAKTFRKPVQYMIETADPNLKWSADKIETRWEADPQATHMKRQIAEDYDAAISSSGGGEREVQLRQAKAEALKNAELLHEARLGHVPQFDNASIQRVGEYAKAFNAMRLMGGSVLSSLGDPVNIAMANGFKDTFSNGFVPALQNYKAALGLVPKELEPDIFRINRIAGAVLEREANGVMGAMMDLHMPLVNKTRGQVYTENAMKFFWKFTGLEGWTQFWKNVVTNTTHARVIDAATRGWAQLSEAERTWLANNRIDQRILGNIQKMHDAQPEKFSAGVPYGAIDQWADKEAASRFAYALRQESNFQIVTPGAGGKLAFQFTPMGSLFMQFRSFGLENASTNIARNVAFNNIVGEKKGNLYGGLLGLATMGAVVDAVKFVAGDSALDGQSKRDPNKTAIDLYIQKWQKTPGEALYNAFDRSSVFMPITEVSNIAQKVGLPNIQGAMSMAFRDEKDKRKGSSRFANRTIWEAALGPTVGLGNDLVGGGRILLGGLGSAVGIGEAFKPTSAEYSNMRRLMIGQNAPGIQQLLNTVHQKMGTAYEWPKE